MSSDADVDTALEQADELGMGDLFTIKSRDLTMKDSDVSIKRGDLIITNCDLAIDSGDLTMTKYDK